MVFGFELCACCAIIALKLMDAEIVIMNVYISGLVLGLTLITTLGPQNIFLIRQGALKRHVILSASVCFLCDVILVTASVKGLHHVLEQHPALRSAMAWAGCLFLLYYGILNVNNAMKKQDMDQPQTLQPVISRSKVIMLALGFSLLNPHAIIDTLILIGGSSGQFPGHEQAFLLGVLSSSLLWFTTLTLVTQLCATWLSKTSVWQGVELTSGLLMIALSAKLAFSQI